jgi:hypothetical protein
MRKIILVAFALALLVPTIGYSAGEHPGPQGGSQGEHGRSSDGCNGEHCG